MNGTPPNPKTLQDAQFTVFRSMTSVRRVIEELPLKHRSVVIKCCQAQFLPPRHDTTNPLFQMIYNLPRLNLVRLSSGILEGFGMVDFYNTHFLKYMNPVESALVLDLCRSMPLDSFQIEEARVASWKKEGVKIEELERKFRINWDIFFDPSRWNEPILGGVAPNPRMAQSIFSSLFSWRRKLEDTVLFPRATRKWMSRSTVRSYCATFRKPQLLTHITQVNWSYIYFTTGIEVEGVTEMRQRWYTSSAKPRTYFAQGGKPYQKSRHLQDAFTSLVNSHPVTNHISRLQPTRLLLREGSHLRVYDLATFTSNMHEQRAFQNRLAQFCYGTTVFLVDERIGLIQRDLGDILEEYNRECVCFPAVSYERVTGDERDMTDHGTASMLGIYGNLMSCTFAHGAVMAQLVEDEDQVNIAGDDGAVDENDENEEQVDLCICALGEYERSKTFRSDEAGCICLKRPLRQSGIRLEQGLLIVPPSLTLIGFHLWGIQDPRYTFETSPSRNGAISIVGKDLMRFLRSVHRASWRLSDEVIESALEGLEGLNTSLWRNRYHEGGLMNCGDPYFWPAYTTVDQIRVEDPLDTLIRNRLRNSVVVAIREYVPSPNFRNVDPGDKFYSNSTKMLSLYERLGLVVRSDCRQEFTGMKARLALKEVFNPSVPVMYEYECVAPIPEHLMF
jgi:hypothetical protein